MDYTLSQYRPETFEVLAYNLTINKLIHNFDYPKVRSTALSLLLLHLISPCTGFHADTTTRVVLCALVLQLALQNANLASFLQELLDFEFDFRYMMRGLIIDKKRGNILKMDRHKYVKVAFHGFRKLTREERLNTYAHARVRQLLLNLNNCILFWVVQLLSISMLACHAHDQPSRSTSKYHHV